MTPVKRPRRRPTYASVAATLALVLSLGGVSYAATKLPANSVGARELKTGAVTTRDVKNKSLLAADFKAGQLPAGPSGPAGGVLTGTYPNPTLASGSVTGDVVAPDTLTGADIDESTLQLGLGTRVSSASSLPVGSTTQFLGVDGVGTLSVTCTDGGANAVGLTFNWVPARSDRFVIVTQTQGDAAQAVTGGALAAGAVSTTTLDPVNAGNLGRTFRLDATGGSGEDPVHVEVAAITRVGGGAACLYSATGTVG